MFDLLLQSLPLAIVASSPLLLAVEGELVVQRSGIINIGVEAMLLAAAFGASTAASLTSSVLLGVAGGIAAAAIVAIIFGVLTIHVRADQIVTGTAVNLLVLGFTGFANRELHLATPPAVHFDAITPFAWIIAPIVLAVLLRNTAFGLRLRACGENPDALPATHRYRWAALMIEAVLVGIAGAQLALILSNGFAENMSAGRGFIALAVVIFGRWNVLGAVLGTAVFGLAAALQYAVQAGGLGIPFHLLLATPYVVTLLILCGVVGQLRAPEALGKS